MHSQAATSPTARSVDLSQVLFSAKIDFVTIKTPGKVPLPTLDGKPNWGHKAHYERLTVHDATPADIESLRVALGSLPILELEVAVDLRSRPGVTAEERTQLLDTLAVDLVARGLEPSAGRCMRNEFRAGYQHFGTGGKVTPFNRRLPKPTEQLLFGGRHDWAQVKFYVKRVDQGAALSTSDHVARVEVRLSGAGLTEHGLGELGDLAGFKFRHGLMPYFTHVSGTARRCKRSASRGSLLAVLYAKRDEFDSEHWAASGVGAFLPGGRREGARVRFLRDTRVNDRIGQALMRLERQHQPVEVRARRAAGGVAGPLIRKDFSAPTSVTYD